MYLKSILDQEISGSKKPFLFISCKELAGDDDSSKVSKETLTLRAHTGPVYSVCFSQDNSFMLSASEDLTGTV